MNPRPQPGDTWRCQPHSYTWPQPAAFTVKVVAIGFDHRIRAEYAEFEDGSRANIEPMMRHIPGSAQWTRVSAA